MLAVRFLAAAVLAVPLAAQCASGDRLLKNDVLPDVLPPQFQFGLVRGLCDNEAAMSVFDTGGPVRVREVGIVYAHRIGTNGVQAVADVELYDGITAQANGRYTLGPLVFRLSNQSTNLQLTSSAYNKYTLPQPVRVTSGRLVVGFRMLMNLASGSCALGYDANFCVDAANTCRPGVNVLDAIGHGPVDPATYLGFSVPLCPLYIRGSWLIRACVTPELATTWTGNPTPGGFVSLKFSAPGQASDGYLALLGGSVAGGGTVLPWGRIPFDVEPLFTCFLGDCRALLLGGLGALNASGEGFGALQIPNLPVLRNSGLTLYAGFVTCFGGCLTSFKSVSPPSAAIVIN
jgi:hypothetical protein